MKKTKSIHARLTDAQYDKLLWLVEQLEVSKSDALGRALDAATIAPVAEVVTAPRVIITALGKRHGDKVTA